MDTIKFEIDKENHPSQIINLKDYAQYQKTLSILINQVNKIADKIWI